MSAPKRDVLSANSHGICSAVSSVVARRGRVQIMHMLILVYCEQHISVSWNLSNFGFAMSFIAGETHLISSAGVVILYQKVTVGHPRDVHS